ncbi:MAG: N-acetylmuramoyl-L-alanine amidase, partial [Blastochloris sp.]|nr:N-acetylmuramoyl-L-alanine amidase [Blastochloris sp.]
MLAVKDFPPDSALVADVVPSPRHTDRRGHGRPDIIVLHYTGLATLEEALDCLAGPGGTVSCHYVVEESGRVLQLVPETRRAWHAGQSHWAGDNDVNSRSIGIEIANPGHDFGCPPYPQAQIAAVAALCRDIIARHAVRPDRVLGHSDVAPLRKRDPGETFPWAELAKAGVGLWIEPARLSLHLHLAQGGTAVVVGDGAAELRAHRGHAPHIDQKRHQLVGPLGNRPGPPGPRRVILQQLGVMGPDHPAAGAGRDHHMVEALER